VNAFRSASLSVTKVRFYNRPVSPCNQQDTFDAEATASLAAGMLAKVGCTVPYQPRQKDKSGATIDTTCSNRSAAALAAAYYDDYDPNRNDQLY
jgi:hypothetical protein